MEIVYKDPKTLKPYPLNNKIHPPEQIKKLRQSIRDFGIKRPFVIDKEDVVVIGHGVLLACLEEKTPPVPCVIASELTPEQIKKLRILDNKLNESPWHIDNLKLELEELPELKVEFPELDIDTLDTQKAFGGLPSGEKSGLEQMTFTLTAEQAAEVKAAMSAAKEETRGQPGNKNGNALAHICTTFNEL